ncbi:MAG TPA: molybdopterin molybdotransferase MoeA [Thermoleophilaceae bacterium]|nr:molybdopterin molybdotransferase MoeA [Thermoleophilaceae bacterium]
MSAPGQREFFTVKTVSEALTGFRPELRTPVETIALAHALGRVPAEPITAPHALPGFARATVDGFAVQAADTYGASEGLPSYLDLIGEARMGQAPETEMRPGGAVAIATGAPLPPGADSVLKVEYTQSPTPELIEVLRPATPGEGMVRADEDAAPGAEIARPGRPLRAQDLGMLAAAGIAELPAYARPRVAIVSTGDELVPADAPGELPVGQVRDSSAPALAALVHEAGGQPDFAGIVPDDREALTATLRALVKGSDPFRRVEGLSRGCDVLVVSAGSSVGARDETAAAIASLGEPGIWCHGLSLKPGKPTLLADVGGIPVIGLPGNPRSALVVFRLIGMPIVRMVGGCTEPPPEPSVRARLTRDLPSAAGRLDVVQVRLAGEVAEPLFGSSSLLSILTAADGYLLVPEAATGLAAGSDVEVMLYH